jgi:hypothetical protein
MALKVIGAGFGRTGTASLKAALEMLGFGPCYHMFEVYKDPGHAALWHAAADGEPIDWHTLFEGYQSAVDWPAAYFWRGLAGLYGDAKVILSDRDPESWHASVSATILPSMMSELPPGAEPHRVAARQMARHVVVHRTFEDRLADRDHAIDVYRQHRKNVTETIAPDRLLVHQSKDGWGPLCEFLEVCVPDAPYPRSNTREEFLKR